MSLADKTVKSITSIPVGDWTSGTDVSTTVAASQIAASVAGSPGTKVVKLVVVTDNNPGTVTVLFTTSNGGSFSVSQVVS